MRLPSGLAACLALVVACHAAPPVGSPSPAEILSCVDLPPGDGRSHNLSGLAWDPATRRLFAVSDRDKQLTVLAPRPGFTGFDLLPAITLDIDASWDGEAVALAGDRFLVVANETTAAVFSVDRSGHGAVRLALPALAGIRDNLGLEALGYVESGGERYVLAINEEALDSDGPTATADHGTVVRILLHPLDRGGDLEVAYLTEPVFAAGGSSNNGVSDLAVLSPDRVLVLERAWVSDKGNAVRIYDVDLRGAQNVLGMPDARAATPVAKRLVVDLATLGDGPCGVLPSPQPSRTLENYEGMALGPTLDDGRQLVFLVADDNLSARQVPRLVTLALAPGAL